MISGFSAAQQSRQVPSRIHVLPSPCIAIFSRLDVTLQLAHPFTVPRRLQQLQASHPQRTWFNWARKEARVKKRIQINFKFLKAFFFFSPVTVLFIMGKHISRGPPQIPPYISLARSGSHAHPQPITGERQWNSSNSSPARREEPSPREEKGVWVLSR